MDLLLSASIYLVLWWVVLFAILPLGARSYYDEGIEVPGGGEPGSPINPNIGKKIITTTWVSAIVFAVIWLVVTFHVIPMPPPPSLH